MTPAEAIAKAWEFKAFETDAKVPMNERLLQSREEMQELCRIAVDPLSTKGVCLETGLLYGGSHYLWTLLFDTVISIERAEKCCQIARKRLTEYGVAMSESVIVCGETQGTDTLERVKMAMEYRPLDFIFLDADHAWKAVQADFETYLPMLRPGGVVAIADTGNREHEYQAKHGPTETYKDIHNCVIYLDENAEKYRVSKFEFVFIDYTGIAWCKKLEV